MSEPTCPVCGQPDVLCCGDCVAPHERGDDYGITDDDTGEFIPHEPEDTPCLDQDTNIANYDPDWDCQPDDLTEQADFEQADEYFGGYQDYDDGELW
jgi:hypothetical protein